MCIHWRYCCSENCAYGHTHLFGMRDRSWPAAVRTSINPRLSHDLLIVSFDNLLCGLQCYVSITFPVVMVQMKIITFDRCLLFIVLLTSEKIKVEYVNFQSRYLFKEIILCLENPVGFYLGLTFRLQRFSDSTLPSWV